MSSAQLRALLSPPSPIHAQESAKQFIASAFVSPILPSQFKQTVTELIITEQARSARLSEELVISNQEVSQLLDSTRNQINGILANTKGIKESHDLVEDALIDHREALVSSLSQRERGEDGKSITLRDKLDGLNQRRKELEATRGWFAVLAKAEALW